MKMTKKLSKGEESLAVHIKAMRLPPPIRELEFLAGRKYRFDFAWPTYSLAVEVDGGNSTAVIGKDGKPRAVGRHTQDSDYQKKNHAVLAGWRVFSFTPSMVNSGEAIEVLVTFFANHSLSTFKQPTTVK